MTLENILKWLSALILLYFAVTFFLAATTIGWLNEGTDRHALLIAMFIAFPGVVSLVASYRQLFQPRPYLILSLTTLIFLCFGAIAIFIQSLPDSYEVGEGVSVRMGAFKEEFESLIIPIIAHLLLLLIPVFSNFRRFYKARRSE